MRARKTSCLRIHNACSIEQSPLPILTETKALKQFWFAYVLPLAECLTKWAALKMSVQIDTRTWAVTSAATCFVHNVFCSAVQGHRQWVEFCLHCEFKISGPFPGSKGNGRWRQCNFIFKLQGWPRSRDTDYQQTTVRTSAGLIPGTGWEALD